MIKANKKSSVEVESAKGKINKPNMQLFALYFCDATLVRMDEYKRLLKKSRKAYVTLMNQIKVADEIEFQKILMDHPEIGKAYDAFDEQAAEVEDDIDMVNKMIENNGLLTKENEDGEANKGEVDSVLSSDKV